MAIDTVKLRSPELSEDAFAEIERLCVIRAAFDCQTEAPLYAITTGELEGSFDHRVSVRPMRKEWITDEEGRMHQQECPPYVLIEGSIHKSALGHNVLGGAEHFEHAVTAFLAGIAQRLGVVWPRASDWIVRQVDWAECFVLGEEGTLEFMQGMKRATFPRRRPTWYGLDTLMFSGDTTTVKVYRKGPEFKRHDYKRLFAWRPPVDEQSLEWRENREAYQRQVSAWLDEVRRLQSEANQRLRFEVAIRGRKLDNDFGVAPRVWQVTTEYLVNVYEMEMRKLLKVGEGEMKTVRDVKSVERRLHAVYSKQRANNLVGWWSRLSAMGEEHLSREVARNTLWRVKKQLSEAGVSWYGGDVVKGAVVHVLPEDFRPLRDDPRRCVTPAAAVLRLAA